MWLEASPLPQSVSRIRSHAKNATGRCRRLEAMEGLESLEADSRAEKLTQALLKGRALPAEAGADAAHVAIAGEKPLSPGRTLPYGS